MLLHMIGDNFVFGPFFFASEMIWGEDVYRQQGGDWIEYEEVDGEECVRITKTRHDNRDDEDVVVVTVCLFLCFSIRILYCSTYTGVLLLLFFSSIGFFFYSARRCMSFQYRCCWLSLCFFFHILRLFVFWDREGFKEQRKERKFVHSDHGGIVFFL